MLPLYDAPEMVRGREIFKQRVFLRAYASTGSRGTELMFKGVMIKPRDMTPDERSEYMENVLGRMKNPLQPMRREIQGAYRRGDMYKYLVKAISDMKNAMEEGGETTT